MYVKNVQEAIEIDKIQALNEWLEQQEAHHQRLAEQSDNIKERFFADAMKHSKSKLEHKGWEETYKNISDFYERAKDDIRVGPHSLAMLIKKSKIRCGV
jgi:hypothetical protein